MYVRFFFFFTKGDLISLQLNIILNIGGRIFMDKTIGQLICNCDLFMCN